MSSRHGTKYRPSLSCSVCRRRKVKCGKEKPACGNCVRMDEVCEYDREPGTEDRRAPNMVSPISNPPASRKHTRSPVVSIQSDDVSEFHQYWCELKHGDGIPNGPPDVPPIRGRFSHQGRPRFVNSTYWGYVPGQVSSHEYLQ
jgi:hypothetical protein